VPLADRLALPPERLRRRLDPAHLGFQTTAEVTPLEGTVGQPRAIDALEFGLKIPTPGFNVFATGISGSGRLTTVLDHVKLAAAERPAPRDWVYVNNFAEPDHPGAFSIPAGMGRGLAHDLEMFVSDARREIARAFELEEYQQRRGAIAAAIDQQAAALRKEFEGIAFVAGFALQFAPGGMALVPIQSGHPLTPPEVEALSLDQREEIQRRAVELQRRLEVELPRLHQVEREGIEHLTALERETALGAIAPLLRVLRERYAEETGVLAHLAAVEADVPEHLAELRRDTPLQSTIPAAFLGSADASEDHTVRYRVNVIVDNTGVTSAPIVVERNPTYYNLLGRVEYRATFGAMVTDFRQIRAGALHRANGGFLVVYAIHLLEQPFVWEALKRALSTELIAVENLAEQLTMIPTSSLRPQPIPLDVKVVLIGSPRLHRLLSGADEDFLGLFKVQADFAPEMAWADDSVRSYAAFIRRTVDSAGLRHFTGDGVARVVEHGARLREDQHRLSTRLAEIADIVAEASYWAGAAGHDLAGADDVQQAIDKRAYRSNLTEERLRQFIDERVISIETDGGKVGQVNGLSVIELGGHSFGMPTRITASVSVGRGRLESIEREINASGPIHSKGFLILSGYLAEQYAQDHPFPMRATITFEQSYDEVEGDSASSTELYAILSALSGIPIDQSIAVTGSVDQHGVVQAVGGVNEKVEGFFKVCSARGLTGRQGVMIPASNVDNLMLDDAVITAVRDGRFHVWAVTSIDEGIELLTGRPAGAITGGEYPEGSVHRLVGERCRVAADRLRAFAAQDGGAG